MTDQAPTATPTPGPATTTPTTTRRRGPPDRGPVRRWIALFALAAGLLGAWWQSTKNAQERQFALLLTHVELRLGDVALDRNELTRLDLVLQPGHVHTLHFAPGAAPQSTVAQTFKVPAEASALDVRCTFKLPSGATLHSRGSVQLPTASDSVQVLDVGACGTVNH